MTDHLHSHRPVDKEDVNNGDDFDGIDYSVEVDDTEVGGDDDDDDDDRLIDVIINVTIDVAMDLVAMIEQIIPPSVLPLVQDHRATQNHH